MAVLECPKRCTASFFDKDDFRTGHTTIKEEDGSWLARCDECGAEAWHPIPGNAVNPAYKTKYPRIEACSGTIVKSREHERETMKRKGYRPVE